MTVQTETSKVVYQGDGETVKFPIPFCFFNQEIAVYVGKDNEILTVEEDYTIEKIDYQNTGNVIFNNPPAEDETITIIRNVPFKQLITFLEGEDFPAVDFENALDRITMALQQLREKLSRSVTVPADESYTEEDLFHCFSLLTKNVQLLENIPSMVEEVKSLHLEILNHYYSNEEIDAMLEPITKLKYENVAIEISSEKVEASEECPGFPYKLDIALSGAVANKVPNVCFNGIDATSGRFASVASSYDGGVSLYLSDAGAYNTIIPTILLH